MTRKKSLFSLGIIILLLACLAPAEGDNTAQSPVDGAELFQKVRNAYSSLVTYSDEGTVTTHSDNSEMHSLVFKEKFARPNLYRIEWTRDLSDYGISPKKKIVWSTGSADYMDIGHGAIMEGKDISTQPLVPNSSLPPGIGQTMISNFGLFRPNTVPCLFFALNAYDIILNDSITVDKNQTHESIDGVMCLILHRNQKAASQIIWIGQDDLLIRKIVTTGPMVYATSALNLLDEKYPELANQIKALSITRTEIHKNIVTNSKLTPPDFGN